MGTVGEMALLLGRWRCTLGVWQAEDGLLKNTLVEAQSSTLLSLLSSSPQLEKYKCCCTGFSFAAAVAIPGHQTDIQQLTDAGKEDLEISFWLTGLSNEMQETCTTYFHRGKRNEI